MISLTFPGFGLAAQNPRECIILRRFLRFYMILKPIADSHTFPGFRPGRPAPLQNAWFYLDSCDFTWFWSQSLFSHTFPGFRPGRPEPLQNLYPVISYDFLFATACYFQLFPAGSWYFLLLPIFSYYFPLVPTISWDFLLFPNTFPFDSMVPKIISKSTPKSIPKSIPFSFSK